MFTHYIENITDDGVTVQDSAGENISATPDWIYRLTASYKLDPWRFNLTARGVSDGVIDNDFTECTSSCPTLSAPYYTINDNHLDGATYFDFSVSRDVEIGAASGEAYIAIKNLFNDDPVLTANPAAQGAENTPGYPQTNRTLYDTMGRVFRVGLRLGF